MKPSDPLFIFSAVVFESFDGAASKSRAKIPIAKTPLISYQSSLSSVKYGIAQCTYIYIYIYSHTIVDYDRKQPVRTAAQFRVDRDCSAYMIPRQLNPMYHDQLYIRVNLS